MFAFNWVSVQCLPKTHSHFISAGSHLGAMYSGLVGSIMFLRACFTRPGLVIGAWPGAMVPALPKDAPLPISSRSTTVTRAPRFAR